MSELSDSINKYRPLYFYVAHEIGGKTFGSKVDWIPAWEAEKQYEVVYKFEGREAAYWIATHDRSILKSDALAFAIAVHFGNIGKYRCDLSEISWKR